MNGFSRLLLGIFGTLAFSWVGLAYIPNLQIGHLDPQMEEDGSDAYPLPKSGMAERGRRIYIANGCFYCHSQQLRADYAGADLDRERDAGASPRPKWGDRRSAPRDYIFDRPVVVGKMRLGPDLANLGKAAPSEDQNPIVSPSPAASPAAPGGASPAQPSAPNAAASATAAAQKPAASPGNSPIAGSPAPSAPANNSQNPATAAAPAAPAPAANASPAATPAEIASPSGSPRAYTEAWHHLHLYSPRAVNIDSSMPAYKFLYEKRRIGGEISADALKLKGEEAPRDDWEIVPSYDAKCLVAYLMSLDQSHALKEVKSAAPAAATSSPPAAPAASPAK